MIDLPRSKYSDPIHTPGKEFVLNGQDYVGWYVVTYLDRYYTGKKLSESSKEIFKIQNTPLTKNDVFVAQEVEPTSYDRLNGIWTRYIIQKVNNQAIIEVSKERFDSFGRTPEFKKFLVEWVIKSPAQDVTKGPYRYKGAESKNRETVSKLEPTIPGITNFFKDYSEFVE